MDRAELMKTNYIWTPDWTGEDDADARIIYFRKAFPMHDLSLTLPEDYLEAEGLHSGQDLTAEALNGGSVKAGASDAGLHIILNTLNAYEAILLRARK